jgi:hypothetical protein
VGPLTAAARTIAGGLTPAAGRAPGDPAAFLARLIDLRGSVELAQRLPALTRPRPAGRAPADAAAPARLRALAGERLEAVREEVVRAFAEAFHRRNKVPTPEGVVAILIDSGALLDRRGRALVEATEAVWTPCGDLMARALDRVRFETSTLREELGPPLAALGPATARLERLDAALFGATAKGRQQLEDRLLAAVARSFAARFATAVAALPGATAPAHVAPWFAADGLLTGEIHRGRDVVLGVLGHERRRLEALVEGGREPS